VEIFESYWGASKNIPISNAQLEKELLQTNGFYFAPYPSSEDYGISISLKHYVNSLIENLFNGKAKVLFHNERGWDNHQDVFAIQKVG